MKISKPLQLDVYVLFIYLLIFFLYFVTCPLHDSLPSDHDSWGNIAMFQTLKNDILALFTGGETGTFGYPTYQPRKNNGTDYLSGIGFIMIQFVLFDTIWSYFLYIVIIFALNAFCIYKILILYKCTKLSSFFFSLVFSFTGFMLSNIDNPNFLFLSFGLAAYYFFKSASLTLSSISLILGGSCLALQLLFGPVGFVIAVMLVVTTFNLKMLTAIKRLSKRDLLIFIAPTAVCFLFFGSLYLLPQTGKKLFNPVYSSNHSNLLISWVDFIRSPEGTILDFPDSQSVNTYSWIKHAKTVFPGFLVLGLVIPSLFIYFKKQHRLIIVLILGLLLSTTFMYYLNADLGRTIFQFKLFEFFRLPHRFFVLFIFSATILSCLLFDKMIKGKDGWIKISAYAIVILNLLLTMPLNFQYFDSKKVDQYCKMVSEKISHYPRAKVLNLPSKLFSDDGDKNEFLYMYIQTLSKTITYNGAFAYYEPERIYTDSLINNDLGYFIKTYQPDIIVVHKGLKNDSSNFDGSDFRHKNYDLKLDTSIFGIYERIKPEFVSSGSMANL